MDCFWQNLTNSSCISCQWVFVPSVPLLPPPPTAFWDAYGSSTYPPRNVCFPRCMKGFSSPALWRETANGFHKPLIQTPVVSTCPSWSSTFGVNGRLKKPNGRTEVYVGEGAVPKGTFFFKFGSFFGFDKLRLFSWFLPSGPFWRTLNNFWGNSHIESRTTKTHFWASWPFHGWVSLEVSSRIWGRRLEYWNVSSKGEFWLLVNET